MSLLAIRRTAIRSRRHGGAVLAVLAICGAIALHHSAIVMGYMHDGHGAGAAVELCLGVFVAVGAAMSLVAIGTQPECCLRPPRVLSAVGVRRAAAAAEPRPRAGPAVLSLLCISRR